MNEKIKNNQTIMKIYINIKTYNYENEKFI